MRLVSRGLVAAAAFCVWTTATGGAQAQDTSEILSSRHRKYESPQNFAVELRLGPYRPDVDSDPALTGTPYRDVFGTTPRLLVAGEFDWQAIRIPYVGTLGPGVGIGYTSIGAKAALSEPRGDRTVSDEETSLDIFPMYAVAVLRVDTFNRNVRIPLVPYAKAGLGFALWRAYKESGTSSFEGVSGKGNVFGTHFALGASFDLNILDEYTARNFDNSMGVNHTYVFFEYYFLGLTGLWRDDVLRVGSNTWAMGLAFEF